MTLTHNQQFARFALGTWFGSIAAGAGEILWRTPALSSSGHELPLEILIAAYIPLSLVLSLPFLGWITVRSRMRGRHCEVPWPVPLMFGEAYLPTLFCSILLLIWITGQDQGAVIGSSIVVMTFGLPILFAELSICISQWRGSVSAPDRS